MNLLQAAKRIEELEGLLSQARNGLICAIDNAKANGDKNFLGYVLTVDSINLALRDKLLTNKE